MAEYIDKEKLIKELIDKGFYPAIVKRAIENAPTEDVVPKSEVEDLKCQLEGERGYIEFLKSIIVSAQQKVAREIFETLKREYKTIINEHECIAISMCDIRHLEKKYIGE